MSIVSVVLGLIAAVVVFLVLSAFIAFPHSALIFALIALVVFFLVARAGITLP